MAHNVDGCIVFAVDFLGSCCKNTPRVGVESSGSPYLLSLVFEMIKPEFLRETVSQPYLLTLLT